MARKALIRWILLRILDGVKGRSLVSSTAEYRISVATCPKGYERF